MSEAYARRDTDKESRLHEALLATLNDFIAHEPTGAANGVILAAMGECFAGTMAYFCATSLDTDAQVQERVALVQTCLAQSVWRMLPQWRNNPKAILRTHPGMGAPNPFDDPDA